MRVTRKELADIRTRLARVEANFAGTPWRVDELSDLGYLALVAVPVLLAECAGEADDEGHEGDAQGEPRTDGIGPAAAALQLMEPEVVVAGGVFPAGNPVAQVFQAFGAKVKGIIGRGHGAEVFNGGAGRQHPKEATV